VRRSLSTNGVAFISDEQALTLQAINGLRDASQHHLLSISESHLYLQTQSGVTLFRDLLHDVFREELRDFLPERVLPVSTIAPADLIALFDDEVNEIARLLRPCKRRGTEATARLRALAIVDGAMLGEKVQPSESGLRRIGRRISGGESSIESLFPGIAGVDFALDGSGSRVNLRITKKEGVPVHLVPEGESNSRVVAVRRVSELDFYNLRFNSLADKLGITTNQTTALIKLNNIKEDENLAKKFFNTWCYSQHALKLLSDCLNQKPAETWWADYREQVQTSKS
jgi:hypothetical protein